MPCPTLGTFRQAIQFVLLIGLGSAVMIGCGVLNPSLIGSVGGNTATTVKAPSGYNVFIIQNVSATPVRVRTEVTKTNGGVVPLNISLTAFQRVMRTQECDIQSVAITEAVAGTDESIDITNNTGTLQGTTDLPCGSVVLIQVTGPIPPLTLQAQVF